MKQTIFKATMLLLAIITTASAWAGNIPRHCLDYCKGGVNNIFVTGWAFDPDVPAASIEIHVYVFKDAACTNKYTAVSIGAADVSRPDVNAAYNITGNHGFQTFIPIDDVGTYYVRVYALDGSGDSNPLMNNPYTAVTVTTHEGIGTSSNPFTIGSKEDWDLFAQLTTDPGTAFYYGLGCYKMTADVGTPEAPVTTMWGTSRDPFSGNFDGDGKTLLVNIVTDGEQAAPFRVVNGATIKNLNAGGLVAVTTDAHNNHAGGLVGYCKAGNTLVDGCNVATRVEAKMYCGGIVGHGGGTGLTIRNSIFRGSIAGFTKCAGGLVGWCDWLSMNLINCLTTGTFEPASGGFYHPIALTNNSGKASADTYDIFYSNTVTPTASTNLVPGGAGIAVSKTRVPGQWTASVRTVDGNFWYAAGTDGYVSFAEGTTDAAHWSITPESPIDLGVPVTLSYTGNWIVKSVSGVMQWHGDLADLNRNVTLTDGMVLTGRLAANVKVSIANGATVTLRDVTIEGVNQESCPWAGITCEGDATIILGGTSYVKGFQQNYPGIFVPEGKTLTIHGNGSLEAISGGAAAGIGGGYNINCGNIVIESGTIIARGGYGAASIGGGLGSSCGDITIGDAVGDVKAYVGWNAPYSVGPGEGGTCGTITVGKSQRTPIETNLIFIGTLTSSIEPSAALSSEVFISLPFEVKQREADSTWTFTMPSCNVVLSTEYNPAGFVTFAEGTKDVKNWSITPDNPVLYDADVTLAYTGKRFVKSVTVRKQGDGDEVELNQAVGGDLQSPTNTWTFTMPEANVVVSVEYEPGGVITFAEGTKDVEHWSIAPDNPVPYDANVTLTYSGTVAVNSVTAKKQGDDDLIVLNPGEADGTWTFTMPDDDVELSVEYEPIGDVTFAEGTEDVNDWVVTPDNPVRYNSEVTLTYTGRKIVERVIIRDGYWNGDLATLVNHVTVTDGMTLTGRLGAYLKVSIADGATVKLQDVTIEGINWAILPWAAITCEGDATIILSGKNYLMGFHSCYPGIFVPKGKTLTIRGDGSLEAHSSAQGPGIGGGDAIDGGNIVIEGGTIDAYGSFDSPGIGCGNVANCGNITITDGVTRVTAYKGPYASYSIGPGDDNSTCGTITIGGVVTEPISESPYTYTGKGTSTSEMPAGLPDNPFVCTSFALTPDETGNTWTFTMPERDVVVSVAYSCDVNNDGSVDVADIGAIIDVMAGNAPALESRADVNGDGSIDVADIARIIDKMAGK